MCARRFLLLIFWLTLIVVAAGFAIFQFGGQILQSQMVPKGHYVAAAARQRPRLCGGGKLDRAARHGRRPVALAADGRCGHGRRAARGGVLHPPDDLSGARPLECVDRRPAKPVARRTVRAQPGQRVQWRRRDLGAALSPGGVRRLPARQSRTPPPRSTSLMATCCARSTSSSPPCRPTARSSSPGTARGRSI